MKNVGVLGLGFGLISLLSLNKLWVVNVAVFVFVIRCQNRVDHVDQLVVLKDLGFRNLLTTIRIVIGFI